MSNYFWKLRSQRGKQTGSLWSFKIEAADRMKYQTLFGVEWVWVKLRNGKPCIETPELMEAA
jgi:hypothetical protein